MGGKLGVHRGPRARPRKSEMDQNRVPGNMVQSTPPRKKTNKQKTHKHLSDGPCGTIVPGTNPHPSQGLAAQKITSQNRNDHGGRKWARNHSAAEIAGFFASPAARKSLAASDFWG